MEASSNQSTFENTPPLGSNVELKMPGMEKTWVRSNGSWTDKTKVPVIKTESFPSSMEIDVTATSHWWQFWKA